MSLSEDRAWSLGKDILLLRVSNEYMTSGVARTFRLVADTWDWVYLLFRYTGMLPYLYRCHR
jgi:hypothetical protein